MRQVEKKDNFVRNARRVFIFKRLERKCFQPFSCLVQDIVKRFTILALNQLVEQIRQHKMALATMF